MNFWQRRLKWAIDRFGHALAPHPVRHFDAQSDRSDSDATAHDWVETTSPLLGRRIVPTYVPTISLTGPLAPRRHLVAEDIAFGDILICVPKPKPFDPLAYAIQTATRSAFTHVAIAGRNGRVHEARTTGVTSGPVAELSARYSYVVVRRIRFPNQLDAERKLDAFFAQTDGKYDFRVALRVPIDDGIADISGQSRHESRDGRYICSEYVRAALSATDFWSSTTDIIFPRDFANECYAPVVGILSEIWPIDYHELDGSLSIEDHDPARN